MGINKIFAGEKSKGHLALLVANVSWGLMAPFLKDLLNGGVITPMALSGFRIIGGALLFWLVSKAIDRRGRTNRKERFLAADCGVVACDRT